MQRLRTRRNGRRPPAGHGTAIAATGLAVLAGLVTATCVAEAAGGWEQAGSGAVAVLPPPIEADAILGASLHCAGQRWQFLFRTASGAIPEGWQGSATIAAGGEHFEAAARAAGSLLAVLASPKLLGAVKAGSRMEVAAGEGAAAAVFALKDSRATIEAISPRCSPVDMSDYTPVRLSADSSDVAAARILFAEEARLFRAATGKEPVYSTARLDLADGRQLMFTSLCGSTSYYGRSGCGLFGHAAGKNPGEWHLVYNTEGLLLYTDPAGSNGDWPNLVTLQLSGGSAAGYWKWNGAEYERLDAASSASQPGMSNGDTEE